MAYNDWTKECFDCASPLLICSTSSRITFFLNLNVGDLGHTFVFGPAGAGKSTFLCLIESQFLKYKNANVIILDKDKSARTITMASGGVYMEPGGEDVAFQPLRDLETEMDLSWAAEFIRLLLEMQGITCDATMGEAITAALKQIRSDKAPERRTLSTFQQYVNYTSPRTGLNEIRTGIQPYTINGEYGRIFDAEDTRLALSKWVMIEMGTLMKMGQAAKLRRYYRIQNTAASYVPLTDGPVDAWLAGLSDGYSDEEKEEIENCLHGVYRSGLEYYIEEERESLCLDGALLARYTARHRSELVLALQDLTANAVRKREAALAKEQYWKYAGDEYAVEQYGYASALGRLQNDTVYSDFVDEATKKLVVELSRKTAANKQAELADLISSRENYLKAAQGSYGTVSLDNAQAKLVEAAQVLEEVSREYRQPGVKAEAYWNQLGNVLDQYGALKLSERAWRF
jgi:energy-coupling factor transporter ATP-binding protein EcfA2